MANEQRMRPRKRKKVCAFCVDKVEQIDYKDTAKRMQLDSISTEAALMDIDTVDPYNSLYFSLCY